MLEEVEDGVRLPSLEGPHHGLRRSCHERTEFSRLSEPEGSSLGMQTSGGVPSGEPGFEMTCLVEVREHSESSWDREEKTEDSHPCHQSEELL